ncbi:phosphotransferase [uncultured Paraglaciecola sp.]|mgnify:CR=1 FL=1|uniref:aminoglycoside phosphotransferase family protein n=1 Tax=uncultured Paraglaciecola sp. TaxID=1765024 RepID=UPI0030DDB42A
MKSPLSFKQLRKQQLHSWINHNTEFECESLDIVSGDAGFRRYYRFVQGGKSIIAVDAPPKSEDTSQYIAVGQSYREKGLKVPEIYAYDLEQGFYLQQDFGNRLFSECLTVDSCDELYPKALANIPVIQNCLSTAKGPLPAHDEAFIDRELGLFNDWLLDKYLQFSVTETEAKMLAKVFGDVKKVCLMQPSVGMHRDYHSRNLMLLEDDEIGVIDFQDAVVGPITYDAVSLLRDSYQDWPKVKVQQWLKNWHAEYYSQYPWAEFKMWFDCAGMQRQIKIAGIFARLCIRDNKPSFLADIPHTLNYLIDVASQYPDYLEFACFVRERVLPNVLQNLKLKKHEA